MKKIKLFLYVAVASLSILSCRDAIEIVQPGEITEEVAIQTVADLESFLIGNVYGAVDTSSEIQLGSIFTDETALTSVNPGHYFNDYRYGLMTNNGNVASTWLNHYRAINRVNRLLKSAERITPANATEQAEYNSILAEARTIRAFSYLQLQSYFTTNLRDDNALGVMLLDGVPEIDENLPRVSNAQIWAHIEDDLNYAEANLLPLTDYKFVTPQLVDAIRARMYTYRGNYTLAKQYAQQVINNSPALTIATPYQQATFQNNPSSNPYKRMWQDVGQGEIIFALSRPSVGPGGNIASNWTTNTTNLTGTPLLGMSYNLFTLLSEPNDVRLPSFVDPTTYDASNTTDIIVIDKYPGKGNTPLKNDIKVFRVSEMYLILAEAAVYENQLAIAADYIQQVRNARRYSGTAPLPSYANQQAGYQDVLKERRVELCFEGHRYVDLRRLGAIAGVSNDRNADDDYFNPNTPLTLSITDHRWTFPIPNAEKLGNPNIQQNPGY